MVRWVQWARWEAIKDGADPETKAAMDTDHRVDIKEVGALKVSGEDTEAQEAIMDMVNIIISRNLIVLLKILDNDKLDKLVKV